MFLDCGGDNALHIITSNTDTTLQSHTESLEHTQTSNTLQLSQSSNTLHITESSDPLQMTSSDGTVQLVQLASVSLNSEEDSSPSAKRHKTDITLELDTLS